MEISSFCKAEWIDGTQQKQRIWDIFKNAPPPLVYDPTTIYKGADHPGFGLLKLTPWRIELANLPGEPESGTQKKSLAKSDTFSQKSLAWRYCKQPVIIQKNVSQNRKEIHQNLSHSPTILPSSPRPPAPHIYVPAPQSPPESWTGQ
jgi:hypothetical protein